MSVRLTVDIARQALSVWQDGACLKRYPVSTGSNGAGEIQGSGCTPRGRHVIRAKIGAGAPINTVFRGRRPASNPRIYTAEAAMAQPGADWILTRILWLSGLEPGRNRLGCVDTFRRYIYIHGTPDELKLGSPGSHGCIRMANSHLIELFEVVTAGTEVTLHE